MCHPLPPPKRTRTSAEQVVEIICCAVTGRQFRIFVTRRVKLNFGGWLAIDPTRTRLPIEAHTGGDAARPILADGG